MTDAVTSAADTVGTVHATALVVGETGLLVTGPSGSGKSKLAMDLIQAAAVRGRFAALVSDDRVGLQVAGKRVLAIAPPPIAGMIELRGSGIMTMTHLPRAVMHVAIAVGRAQDQPRLPPAGARYTPEPGVDLPLFHMVPGHLHDPMDLILAFRQDRLVR